MQLSMLKLLSADIVEPNKNKKKLEEPPTLIYHRK